MSPTSGTGSAAGRLRIDESTRIDPRTLTVIVNNQPFVVVQEGFACVYTLSMSTIDSPNEGSQQQIRVTAASGCRWSVTTGDSWITVRTPDGVGTDWAYFSIAPNGGAARQGSITIAGQRVLVTQARG